MKHGLLLKVLMVIAIASMIVPSISAAPAPFSPYIQASRLEEVYEDAPMDSSWLYQIDEVKFRSIGLDPTRLYWRSQLDVSSTRFFRRYVSFFSPPVSF